MSKPNITFNLWPDGAFTPEDVVELEDIISNIDSTSGRTNSDLRGLDLQTTIEFVSLVVATAFFAKFGADIYDHLKKRFAKVLTRPLEKSKQEGTYKPEEGGIIWLFTYVQRILVRMTCIYEDEEGFYKFVDRMNKGLNWLNSEIVNKRINPDQEGEIEFKFVDRKKGNPSGWDYTDNELLYEIKIRVKPKIRDWIWRHQAGAGF